MRPDDDRRWLDLADRIGRGESIDWTQAEAGLREADDPALFRSMRTLSAILQLHSKDHEASPSDTSSASPELTSWGPLELRGRLGHGSYGTVFDAYDPQLDREVALKLMHPGKLPGPEAQRRMLEEGRAMARVRHENLIQVHGADRVDDRVGIWMEKVEGETLAARVSRDGPMSEDEVRAVARPIGQALAALHQAGILHRDVKAHNVMREAGGRLVLMDLGAATTQADLEGRARVTGTPLYLAPESLQGQSATERSDVYALGVLLFHLLTGEYPVTAADLEELKAAHFEGRRRLVSELRPDVNPRFAAWIDRATHPDPEQRFASAGALVQALTDGPSPAEPRRDRGGRSRFWIPALAALVAAVAVGVWTTSRGPDLSVDTTLVAWGADGSRRELFQGAEVVPGDALSLEFTSSHDVYVYVLTEDDQGASSVLFPRPGFAVQNPVPAGDHTLPERNAMWGVDTAGGREHILVLASRDPLPELERQLPADDRPARLEDGSLARLRGIGSVVRRPAAAQGPGSLLATAERVLAAGHEADGVWMRAIVLRNAAP